MSFETYNILIEEFIITKDDKVVSLSPEEVISFEVFEAITAPFITGRIIITQHNSIEELLPITGDETITLKFKSGEDPLKTLSFQILSGKDDVVGSDRQNYQRTYKLFVADKQFSRSIDREYSRSFKEELVSKMIQHIAGNMVGTNMAYVEPTKHEIDYIMSYVTPIQAIKELSEIASSVNYNDGGYCFFQNTEVGHQFRSLSSMFQQKPIIRLIPNAHNSLYVGNVQRWERLSDFNILNAIKERTIGMTTVGWNKFTKEIINEKISLNDFFENTVTLGAVSLFRTDRINTQAIRLKNTGDSDWLKVSGKNQIKRGMINQSQLKLHMQGTSRLAAGQVVNFYLDSQDNIELENQKITGKYLIKSLNHIWNESHYMQVMTVVRDSYSTLSENSLVRSTKNVSVG